MKSTIITALDIGSTMVRSIIARTVSNDKLELLGMGKCPSDGIERGIVKDIQALAECIKKSLNQAEVAAAT